MGKTFKKVVLYFTVFIYALMGVLHLVKPQAFLFIMPPWLPFPLFLIYLSGVAEIVLALLLIPKTTRRVSAWLIVAMLLVYLFLIHIPQMIAYYKTGNENFIYTALRVPLQFLFIYLIYPKKRTVPKKQEV